MSQVSDLAMPNNDPLPSDFMPDQYPAYLLPDGTWRFGENAKRLAEAAWAFRRPRYGRESPDC